MSNYGFVKGLRAIRDYRPDPLAEEDLEAILDAGRWTGSSKNRQDWSMIIVSGDAELAALAKAGSFTGPLRKSAVTVALVREPGGNDFDVGRLAQNLMLAARAVGVASCPITLHREDKARQVLGVPADRGVRYAVAFGYPSDTAEPRRYGGRKPLSEVARRHRYQ